MRRSFVAGLVLVVALGACGSEVKSASKVSTVALVAGAADAAAEAKTARIEGYVLLRTDTKDVSVPVKGEMDTAKGAMSMRMDAAAMIPGAEGDIELRMVDGAMYMGFGDLLADAPGAPRAIRERPWVEVEIPEGASSAGTQNFADQLAALRGAGDVQQEGHDEIRGVETTKYHAEIDVQRALDRVASSDRDTVQKALGMFGDSLPMDVWIDDDGLPRRIAMKVHMTTDGHSITVDERMDFYDFGTDVSVEAPPPSEVMSMVEFQALAGGSKRNTA